MYQNVPKKRCPRISPRALSNSLSPQLYRAGHFTAAETARTNMDTPRRAVDYRRDALNIRFPHAVTTPVGVTDLDAERNTLTAIITFCHLLHLLAYAELHVLCVVLRGKTILLKNNAPHDNRPVRKMQVKVIKIFLKIGEKRKYLQILVILYRLMTSV